MEKTKMRITFRNDFHNSESTKIAKIINGKYVLSPDQIRRAGKECCGIFGCSCGEFRGGIFDEDGNRLDWADETTLKRGN